MSAGGRVEDADGAGGFSREGLGLRGGLEPLGGRSELGEQLELAGGVGGTSRVSLYVGLAVLRTSPELEDLGGEVGLVSGDDPAASWGLRTSS